MLLVIEERLDEAESVFTRALAEGDVADRPSASLALGMLLIAGRNVGSRPTPPSASPSRTAHPRPRTGRSSLPRGAR